MRLGGLAMIWLIYLDADLFNCVPIRFLEARRPTVGTELFSGVARLHYFELGWSSPAIDRSCPREGDWSRPECHPVGSQSRVHAKTGASRFLIGLSHPVLNTRSRRVIRRRRTFAGRGGESGISAASLTPHRINAFQNDRPHCKTAAKSLTSFAPAFVSQPNRSHQEAPTGWCILK